LENGAEVFFQEGAIAEYERRIADLEQWLGKKEVEIALLKNFLGRSKRPPIRRWNWSLRPRMHTA
jgi:hypothetical protein